MIDSLYEPFKKWSEKGSVYIISDTHFEDEDCSLMDVAWPSSEEQVNLINNLVHKNDTLIHLGDVGNPDYIAKLKAGHKVLIMGNHDKGRTVYEPYFDEVYEGPLMISPHIMLSHEPCGSPFWCNFHGHCHDSIFKYFDEEGGYNFAANIIDYTPISLGTLIKKGFIKHFTCKDIHRTTIDYTIERKQKKND